MTEYLDSTDFKAFADNKKSFAKMMISVFDVGKEENAGHQPSSDSVMSCHSMWLDIPISAST